MKKLIYLCLAFCMTTTLTFAQKVTKENLQGDWQIVALDLLNTEGVYIDLVKEDVTFSEAIKTQAFADVLEQVKGQFTAIIPVLKPMKMTITNDEFRQDVANESEKGKFALTEEGSDQMFVLDFENGTKDKVKISFKENLLYIDTVTDGIFVYKKV